MSVFFQSASVCSSYVDTGTSAKKDESQFFSQEVQEKINKLIN